MASVGLLSVGAVLFRDGLMLLGRVDVRAAIPLNLFVGLLQVITPTSLVLTAAGDPAVVLNASGLYLFGSTYLSVALNTWIGLDETRLGYFSLFVAICAVVDSPVNFTVLGDPAFGVIWLRWALLWSLFFLLLRLGRGDLTRFTGLVAAIQGWATAAVPAFLLITGAWEQVDAVMVVLLVVVGLGYAALYPRFTRAEPSEVLAHA